MSWIRSLMMASGWSCAENAQSEEGGGEEEEDGRMGGGKRKKGKWERSVRRARRGMGRRRRKQSDRIIYLLRGGDYEKMRIRQRVEYSCALSMKVSWRIPETRI